MNMKMKISHWQVLCFQPKNGKKESVKMLVEIIPGKIQQV